MLNSFQSNQSKNVLNHVPNVIANSLRGSGPKLKTANAIFINDPGFFKALTNAQALHLSKFSAEEWDMLLDYSQNERRQLLQKITKPSAKVQDVPRRDLDEDEVANTVSFLQDIEACAEKTDLMRAALTGNLRLVKYLVKQGSDINATVGSEKEISPSMTTFTGTVIPAQIKKSANFSALTMAIVAGHLPVVEFLLQQGATLRDVTVNSESFSPVTLSMMCGNYPIVQHLVSQGAKHYPLSGLKSELAQIEDPEEAKPLQEMITSIESGVAQRQTGIQAVLRDTTPVPPVLASIIVQYELSEEAPENEEVTQSKDEEAPTKPKRAL